MRRIAEFKSKIEPTEPDFSVAQTDLDELISKAQEILRREITNLMIASTGKLLSRDNAMSLTAYIKLLGELKEAETKALKALGDEHLEKLVKDGR